MDSRQSCLGDDNADHINTNHSMHLLRELREYFIAAVLIYELPK